MDETIGISKIKTKELAKLAKAVKKIMAYKPPPGSLKKPEKIK